MRIVWTTLGQGPRNVSISDANNKLIRYQRVQSLTASNNNFTSFSLPVNTPFRFSSPLHKGVTKIGFKFGSTEYADDFLRFTLDDLPSAPAVGGMPSAAWKSMKTAAQKTSVAAVNSCTLSTQPLCFFFEKKATPACSTSTCGSLHVRLRASNIASNHLDMNGEYMLVRMALTDMSLNFGTTKTGK